MFVELGFQIKGCKVQRNALAISKCFVKLLCLKVAEGSVRVVGGYVSVLFDGMAVAFDGAFCISRGEKFVPVVFKFSMRETRQIELQSNRGARV